MLVNTLLRYISTSSFYDLKKFIPRGGYTDPYNGHYTCSDSSSYHLTIKNHHYEKVIFFIGHSFIDFSGVCTKPGNYGEMGITGERGQIDHECNERCYFHRGRYFHT